MAEIILTDETFENEVLNSDKPVIVDFFATWCAPCSMLAPILEEVAKDYADSVKVCKMDVDKCPVTSMAFKIESIPTLISFNNGKMTDMVVGFTGKERIVEMIGK